VFVIRLTLDQAALYDPLLPVLDWTHILPLKRDFNAIIRLLRRMPSTGTEPRKAKLGIYDVGRLKITTAILQLTAKTMAAISRGSTFGSSPGLPGAGITRVIVNLDAPGTLWCKKVPAEAIPEGEPRSV
jgi:hypothetical protein